MYHIVYPEYSSTTCPLTVKYLELSSVCAPVNRKPATNNMVNINFLSFISFCIFRKLSYHL
jgi:hypothetical protein